MANMENYAFEQYLQFPEAIWWIWNCLVVLGKELKGV